MDPLFMIQTNRLMKTQLIIIQLQLVRGTIIIDTIDNTLKIYNGAAWVNIVTGV